METKDIEDKKKKKEEKEKKKQEKKLEIYKQVKVKKKEKKIQKKEEKRKYFDEILSKMTDEEKEKYKEEKYKVHGEFLNNVKKGKDERLQRTEDFYNNSSLDSVISVCIDCNFEDKMSERELKSMAQQIQLCYGRNVREVNPFYLAVTGLKKDSKILLNLEKKAGFKRWKMKWTEKEVDEYFKSCKKIIYLTPDSENVLQELEVGNCYVIGGIIDKNRHKGICENKAKELNIETARFPIKESEMLLTSSHVLTTNHVFDILHEKKSKSWKDALETIIPKRKIDE